MRCKRLHLGSVDIACSTQPPRTAQTHAFAQIALTRTRSGAHGSAESPPHQSPARPGWLVALEVPPPPNPQQGACRRARRRSRASGGRSPPSAAPSPSRPGATPPKSKTRLREGTIRGLRARTGALPGRVRWCPAVCDGFGVGSAPGIPRSHPQPLPSASLPKLVLPDARQLGPLGRQRCSPLPPQRRHEGSLALGTRLPSRGATASRRPAGKQGNGREPRVSRRAVSGAGDASMATHRGLGG